jgi:hypothetical protein
MYQLPKKYRRDILVVNDMRKNKTLKNAFHPQFPIFQSNIVKHVKWYGQKHMS